MSWWDFAWKCGTFLLVILALTGLLMLLLRKRRGGLTREARNFLTTGVWFK